MGYIIRNGIEYGGTATTASQVMYNTTESVADKLDEVDTKTGSDIAVSSGATETIAEAISFLSQTVSIPTYGGTLLCRKFGRVVSLMAWGIGSTSAYPSGSRLILPRIIPQDYRPNDEEYVYGSQTGNEAGTTSALYVLKSSGDIETHAYSKIGGGRFSISYIV